MSAFAPLLDSLLNAGGLEPTLRRNHFPCRRLIAFDDFYQEVLLRGLRHADSFRGQTEAELAGWFRAIAQQEMIEHLRRSQRERLAPLPLELLDQRTLSPQEQLDQRERLNWLARALASLEEADRLLMLRHYFEGLTFVQIARERGVKHNTLVQQHLRLLSRLRDFQ